ncbi:Hypothetical protein, putative [Bodo saltans]|uniref:GRIP domain-containing protein n=1 Tax=Bodo saltans TaxID=75058 RepID=A0A0S4KIU3_BODSA|nr:Hypothetical protein, putative [Bodo saltans]|eukprot:CUI15605.1 Hypothetical protein, putative [Bodo saltans]
MPVDEVSALKAEVEKSQEKLAEWKAKAKKGVDQLREQLLEASDQLSRVRSERDSLRAQIVQLGEPSSIATSSATMSSASCALLDQAHRVFSASAETLFHGVSLQQNAFVDAVRTLRQEQQNGSSQQQQSQQDLQAAFDKYRRRAEQSIKLSSKQQETLAAENKDLQKELEHALQELNHHHQQAAEVRTSLEKQLDTALYAIDTLRSEQADRNRQDQQRVADENDRKWISVDEAKAEIELVHGHFVEREEELRQRHTEEIQRLHHAHEEAIAMLEEELATAREESPLLASSSRREVELAGSDGLFASDEAYGSLLQERDLLKAKIQEREARIQQLEKNLDKNTAAANSTTQDRCTTSLSPASSSFSPASAKQRISELELQVSTLSEQLWVANNVILENKAKRSTDKTGKSTEGQQSSYLKSIVVKLLCEKSDAVRSNLVPVLATLLVLDPEDLRSIYTANPAWR